MKNMLKAIIFDFDGVIIDTETARFLSWKEAFSWYGINLGKEEWLKYLGIPGEIFDPLGILKNKTGKVILREDVGPKRLRIFWEHINKMSINPGIMDYLNEAKKRNIKFAIASSSKREWVQEHFKMLDIGKFFAVIKNSDDVKRIKPFPDLYLEALKELKVNSNEAIAVEDSLTGVQAAKNAGLFCICIPNGLNKGMKINGADIQLKSLKDLEFGNLVKLIEKKSN